MVWENAIPACTKNAYCTALPIKASGADSGREGAKPSSLPCGAVRTHRTSVHHAAGFYTTTAARSRSVDCLSNGGNDLVGGSTIRAEFAGRGARGARWRGPQFARSSQGAQPGFREPGLRGCLDSGVFYSYFNGMIYPRSPGIQASL